MLESIRRFVAELTGSDQESSAFAEDDYRVAAAALLVHVIDSDGMVEEAERRTLHELLKARFGLSDEDTDDLIEVATRKDHEAIDLYAFTSVLQRQLDREGRLRIVEMMWELVYADGASSELEDNIVWRVAELLGIDSRDRIALKRSIAGRLQQDLTDEEEPSAP